ncbi:MAG: hypothetical protein QM703_22090 [Gemmatales bacterium]
MRWLPRSSSKWKLTKPVQLKRRCRPALELLEDRLNPAGQLLPIVGQEHVFDDLRHVIYASNGTQIQRYDYIAQQVLPAWTIGSNLIGLDITPDYHYLVVAEGSLTGTIGSVYKVDLNSGTVAATLTFPAGPAYYGGAYDVVMVSNTKGFVSYYPSEGETGLREIDLSTNLLTIRPDRGIDGANSFMQRSADRSKVFFSPNVIYDTASNSFNVSNSAYPYYFKYSATNRNGTQFAQQTEDYELDVFDSHLRGIETKMFFDSDYEGHGKLTGIIFDPVLDRAYLGNTQSNSIDVYETNSWKRLYSTPIGANLQHYYEKGPLGYGSMSISSDGQYLIIYADGLRLIRLLDSATAPVASLKVDNNAIKVKQSEVGTVTISPQRQRRFRDWLHWHGTFHQF